MDNPVTITGRLTAASSITDKHCNDAHVIVFGNAKGGTGKSTMAMHVIVGLLNEGYRVGAIDLDAKQGTLTRYFDNRRVYADRLGLKLPQPLYRTVGLSELRNSDDAQMEESERLERAIEGLSRCDFIVIDTPGADNYLSETGHFYADVLITPLNDSFVDIDQLAQFDATTNTVLAMGHYAVSLVQQRRHSRSCTAYGGSWK